MHELSVTESILEIALRHSRQAVPAGDPPPQVTDLFLVIGQMSSIIDDSVQFYWDMLTEGTPAEGAQLHFRRIPTELLCLDCSNRYQPPPESLECPQCGSLRFKVIAGEEFFLEAINIEPVSAGASSS